MPAAFIGNWTEEEKNKVLSELAAKGVASHEVFCYNVEGKIFVSFKYTVLLKMVSEYIEGISYVYADDASWCEIAIKRKGWQIPFNWRVYLSDYKNDNYFWQVKPHFMLQKTALSQSIRILFSDILDFSFDIYGDDEAHSITKKLNADNRGQNVKNTNTEQSNNINICDYIRKKLIDSGIDFEQQDIEDICAMCIRIFGTDDMTSIKLNELDDLIEQYIIAKIG